MKSCRTVLKLSQSIGTREFHKQKPYGGDPSTLECLESPKSRFWVLNGYRSVQGNLVIDPEILKKQIFWSEILSDDYQTLAIDSTHEFDKYKRFEADPSTQ